MNRFFKISIIILYHALFISSFSFAQSSSQINNQIFSANYDFGLGLWNTIAENFVEVSYGFGNLNHKKIKENFNDVSLSEIKIGRRFTGSAGNYKILSLNDSYLFSSYVTDNTISTENSTKIKAELWRFGLGYRKGFGYNFAGSILYLHNQFGFIWNKSSFNFNQINLSENSQSILKKYDDLRFGTISSGGVDLRLMSFLGVGALYETTVIFPRHLFWKQSASFFIELFSQTGIDFFTEGVLLKSVPRITPIFYFLLKNGLSYFFYTLKQDKMNWPFNTETPLTTQAIKFNLNIFI